MVSFGLRMFFSIIFLSVSKSDKKYFPSTFLPSPLRWGGSSQFPLNLTTADQTGELGEAIFSPRVSKSGGREDVKN